ncbi:lipopolysaccharide biosynthesis protein [Priestia megaterium]|uniref:lipopolysaccharide biosynthesis protein n=1 Tax=Priestia megaterium TaxID=1404 RepID=UPI00123A09DB|nr:oligosaccharide flippase family protein [Priestia megaterium]KAA8750764.1 oligosaccharide flippase family protein [Priestia megaterium]MED4263426.1 oligosaccharide flippase family protein [Priestia megaterium]MED4276694.1 oligosaccharide flippase family protein [Priestia megaterium]MED4316463.1 oligosaccharide flippase family protein [Priestia megaterium]
MISIKNNLFSSGVLVLIGNLITAALTFLATSLLAKNLGVTEFGLVTFSITFSAVLAQVIDFGMDINLVKTQEDKREKTFIHSLFIKISAFCIVLIILLVVSPFLYKLNFWPNGFSELWWIVLLGALFISLNNLQLASLQSDKKFKNYVLNKFLVSFFRCFFVFMFFLFLYKEIDIKFLFYLYFFIPYFSTLYFISRRLNLTFDISGIKNQAKFGLYIMVSNVASSLLINADILMVQYFLGADSVAQYGVANLIIAPISLIISSMMTVLLPNSQEIKTFEEMKEYVWKVLRITIPIALIIFGILFFAVKFLITIIYGEDYLDAISITRILLFGFCFSILTNPIYIIAYALNNSSIMMIGDLIKLALNILLNIYMIPSIGTEGAAYATTITRVIGGIITIVIISRYVKKGRKNGKIQ